MVAVAALLCCCDGDIIPLPCDELPTSVVVSWTGEASLTYSTCTCVGSGYQITGTGTADTSCGGVAMLVGCVYLPGFECFETITLNYAECDNTPVGTVSFRVLTTVGPPVANVAGTHAGYWTVGVTIGFYDFPTVGDQTVVESAECLSGAASTCGIWGSGSVVFRGPLISSSPVGAYTANEGTTWFDCTLDAFQSISADDLGSVTVS